jgi:hypothetical protein
MPPLSNPRQEKFVQLAVAGAPLIEAYVNAGYDHNYGNASRLKSSEKVDQRMKELQGYAADLTQVTVATLVGMADEVRGLAIVDKQHSAAVGAIKEMGILTGLRIDRREVGSPGEFERMSDEELMKEIQGSVELVALPDAET